MFCSKCGSKLPDGSQFCNNCGQKLEISTEPVVVPSLDNNDFNETKASLSKKESVDTAPRNIAIGCISVFVVFLIIFSACVSSGSERSKPKRFEDYTNKEMQDFLNWQDKQKQKERDNAPFFK